MALKDEEKKVLEKLGEEISVAKGRQGFYLAVFVSVAAIDLLNLASIIASFFGEMTTYVTVSIVIKSIIFLILGIYCFYIYSFLTYKVVLYKKGLELKFLTKSISVPFTEITEAKLEKLSDGVKIIIIKRLNQPEVRISQKSLEKGQFKVIRLYLQEKGILSIPPEV